jgi:hypothetical protein
MASDEGLIDGGLKLRTMRLPDLFQDQDKPEKQYDQAGLNAEHIVDTVLKALRHNSAGRSRGRGLRVSREGAKREGAKEGMQDLEDLHRLRSTLGTGSTRSLVPACSNQPMKRYLLRRFRARGLDVERQRLIPVTFEGVTLAEGFRADLVVGGQLIIEIKSVERNAPVHAKTVADLSSPDEAAAGSPYELRLRDVSRWSEARRERL